jgi:small ligand-binding sensory domain FIST
MMRGAGDKAEFLTRTTEAFGAVFDAQQKALLTLVFDCGGRRGVLFGQKRLGEEYGVMKKFAGDSPLFGLYGGGEVGCAELGAAPTGVGYHVSVAALLPGPAPE